MLSKENKIIEKASANAITLLNYSNFNFFNCDFSMVNIPQANLSYSNLNCC